MRASKKLKVIIQSNDVYIIITQNLKKTLQHLKHISTFYRKNNAFKYHSLVYSYSILVYSVCKCKVLKQCCLKCTKNNITVHRRFVA